MGSDQTASVDVFLVLADDRGRLLLALRAGHLYAGGQWNVPSGKAETGEDVFTAVRREAREEIGVRLARDDLRPAAVVHYRQDGEPPRVGFAFAARYHPDRHGPVVNAEPHKCDGIGWYQPAELPQPVQPYTRAVLAAAAGTDRFAVVGWDAPATGR
jgi:8-oxo-dGTP diphosphatase